MLVRTARTVLIYPSHYPSYSCSLIQYFFDLYSRPYALFFNVISFFERLRSRPRAFKV